MVSASSSRVGQAIRSLDLRRLSNIQAKLRLDRRVAKRSLPATVALRIGYQLGMTEKIVIRPAHVGDRGFVVGLVPSLVRFGSPAWRDVDDLVPRFGDLLARAVGGQDRRVAVLVAQARDETPLGFISLRVVENIEGGDRGHVADLAVSEAARRMGVGTALMEAAEMWARDRGFDLLSLDVWSTNDGALAFYRRLGYSVDSLSLIKRLD
ncbi:MAG: GNAT family N-acetyltransferase [Solirubrobacteraceae bacterium]